MIEAILNQSKEVKNPENHFREISSDDFKKISKWYHIAILKLTSVKNFKNDPIWISKHLGIKRFEAKEALEALLELGLLEQKDGHLVDVSGSFKIVAPDLASARIHQANVMQRGIESISMVPTDLRTHSVYTIPANKNKVKIIRDKFRKFSAEIDVLLDEENEEKDDIFHLSFSFFPASRIVS